MPTETHYNLSDNSIKVLKWMIQQDTTGMGGAIPLRLIMKEFELDRPTTEDVVGQLESNGLATLSQPPSGPQLEATPQAPVALVGHISFDASTDAGEVATALCDNADSMSGQQIEAATTLDVRRVNFAARYLESEGLAEVMKELGANQFCFSQMAPTYETRKFIGRAS